MDMDIAVLTNAFEQDILDQYGIYLPTRWKLRVKTQTETIYLQNALYVNMENT